MVGYWLYEAVSEEEIFLFLIGSFMSENRYRIIIEADNKGRPVVKQAEGDLRQLSSQAKKTGAEAAGSFERMKDSSDSLFSSMGRLVGVVGVGFGVAEIIRTADEYKNLEGRLSLVTDSKEEMAVIDARLFDIAQDTRVAYSGTIDLYARIARSTKELNIADEERLTVTDTINKSLIISGASAEAANAALVQLGQGFASGVLRGEELNSVLEQAPRLAEAIADGMDATIGELRAMGAEGELVTSKVIGALVSQGDAITREFDRMPKTVGQSLTVLNNSIGAFIAGTDRAGGFTGILADGIIDISGAIDELRENNDDLIKQDMPVMFRGVIDAAVEYADELKMLAEVLIVAKGAQLAMNIAVSRNPYVLAVGAVVVLNEALKKTGEALGNSFGDFGSMYRAQKGLAEDLSEIFDVLAGKRDASTGELIPKIEQIENRIASLNEEMAAADATEKPWYLFSVFPDAQAGAENVNRLKEEIAELQGVLGREQISGLQDMVAGLDAFYGYTPKKKEGSVGPNKDDIEKAKKIAEDWKKVADDLQNEMKTAGLSGLEKELADISIKAEKLREKPGADNALIDSWRQHAEAIAVSNDEMGKMSNLSSAVSDAHKSWNEAVVAGLSEQEQAVARVREEFAGHRQEAIEGGNLLGKSSADINAAIAALDNAEKKAVGAIISDSKYGGASLDELKNKYVEISNSAMPEFERGLADINEQFFAMRDALPGLIDIPGVTFEKLAELDEELARRQAAAVESYINENKKIEGFWEGVEIGARGYAEETKNIFEDVADATESAFDGMTDELAAFVVKGKADVSGLVDSILMDLARIQIQQSITGPLSSAFSGFVQGLFSGGTAAATTTGTTTGVWTHSGGEVGFGGWGNGMAQLPSSLFYDAPRLHNGLAPDEFPAILQQGETVLPRGVSPGGGVTVNVYNTPGASANVSDSQTPDGGMSIDIMIDQIESRMAGNVADGKGQLTRTFERTYGLSRAFGAYRG